MWSIVFNEKPDLKVMIAVFFVKYLLMCLCVCLPHCPPGRLCVHWSRTMQPENRGWPSSWSRWWPSWVWRAEDRTSQGALGRDPIRNRAVPERTPSAATMLCHYKLTLPTTGLACILQCFWLFIVWRRKGETFSFSVGLLPCKHGLRNQLPPLSVFAAAHILFCLLSLSSVSPV